MTYAYHWRKAMTISVCLHLFLVVGAGYLVAGLASPLPQLEEVMLEMDLVSDPAEQVGNTALPEQAPLPDQPKLTEVSPLTPVQAENKVREPVVTTSELAMTAAESPAIASTSNHNATSSSSPTVDSPAAVPLVRGGSQSGVAAPGILEKVNPIYPQSARQAGLEGTVVLKVQILANGQPGEITVSRSSGYAVLDEAAITAVGKWQFIPAKDRTSGRTVSCTTTLPVSFRLHDQSKG